jgi:hypothetical protein
MTGRHKRGLIQGFPLVVDALVLPTSFNAHATRRVHAVASYFPVATRVTGDLPLSALRLRPYIRCHILHGVELIGAADVGEAKHWGALLYRGLERSRGVVKSRGVV